MANCIVGTIASISAKQDLVSQKTGTQYSKRELIIMKRRFDPNTGEPLTDQENTPQFTFIGDRCDLLDNFQVGQVVSVFFDVDGRKYTDQSGATKIITEVRPYKVELYQPRQQSGGFSSPYGQQPSSQPAAQPQQQAPAPRQQNYQQNGYGQQNMYGQQNSQAPSPQAGNYEPPF